MTSNTEIITEFIATWSTLDATKLAEYFTEEGSYYNMPARPVIGKRNVENFIRQFITNWTETEWEILNIIEDGNLVYCERLDKTKTTAGNVDLPCFGIFEMENGKIREWRDYFDMATFVNGMSK